MVFFNMVAMTGRVMNYFRKSNLFLIYSYCLEKLSTFYY